MTANPATAPVSERVLPAWPVIALFGGIPLWWILGFGELAIVLFAGFMGILLARRGRVAVPRGFVIWLVFLVWIALSGVMIDSASRFIGYGYRLAQYLAVTVVFVYLYNARARLSASRTALAFVLLWIWTALGGLAGLAFPLFEVRTPLFYLLPESLRANELVQEMVIRRVAGYEPDSWTQLDPRPSAPFLFTNGWGNVYSLLAPVIVALLLQLRPGRWRALLVIVSLASLVPAMLSLNRGMFIGFGVALAYAGLRLLLAGRFVAVAAIGAVGAVVAVAAVLLGVPERLAARLTVSSTTSDRASLYLETFERTLASPLFGYGAPRPSVTPGAPSAGTQGQVWFEMFSHGFVGLALYLLWLGWCFAQTARAVGPLALALHTVQLVLFVESFYYGVMPWGLLLAMMGTALLLRAGGGSGGPGRRSGLEMAVGPAQAVARLGPAR